MINAFGKSSFVGATFMKHIHDTHTDTTYTVKLIYRNEFRIPIKILLV